MLDLSRLSPGHRKRSSPPSPQQDEEMEHSPQSKRSRKNWTFLQFFPMLSRWENELYISSQFDVVKDLGKIDHKDLSSLLRAPQMMHKILLFKISIVSEASGVFFFHSSSEKDINASISKSALNLPNRDLGSSWDVYRERWLAGRKSARWVATWTLRKCTTGRFSTGREGSASWTWTSLQTFTHTLQTRLAPSWSFPRSILLSLERDDAPLRPPSMPPDLRSEHFRAHQAALQRQLPHLARGAGSVFCLFSH